MGIRDGIEAPYRHRQVPLDAANDIAFEFHVVSGMPAKCTKNGDGWDVTVPIEGLQLLLKPKQVRVPELEHLGRRCQ